MARLFALALSLAEWRRTSSSTAATRRCRTASTSRASSPTTARGGSHEAAPDLAARLTRLEDIEAIRTLVARYALGADRNNDPAILGPLFAKDAEWVCEGFGHYRGRDEIAAELAGSAARPSAGRCTTWSRRWSSRPRRPPRPLPLVPVGAGAGRRGGRGHWIGGWYESRLKKGRKGWRFTHVRLHLKLLSPHADGWKTLPAAD
jgi:hypothetical protein